MQGKKDYSKWLELGNCDMVLFKQDRGDIFVIQKLKDVFNGRKTK